MKSLQDEQTPSEAPKPALVQKGILGANIEVNKQKLGDEARQRERARQLQQEQDMNDERIADAVIQNKPFPREAGGQNPSLPALPAASSLPGRIAEKPGQEEDDGGQNAGSQFPGTALNTERTLLNNDEPAFLKQPGA